MDHTLIITPADLDEYANRRDSQSVIPELIYLLVKQSVSKISVCRIPYGDAVNQPGWDGLVETEEDFLEFVPMGTSYWEIGTGNNPLGKATKDFTKRTKALSDSLRSKSAFIFVTPRSSGAEGCSEPQQTKWLNKRQGSGWKAIRFIDGVKLTDWLREFPAIGRWMSKKIGLSLRLSGIFTPTEHWVTIQAQSGSKDPPLPPEIFTIGRENACTALQGLFEGRAERLLLFAESLKDVDDFVSAYLSSIKNDIATTYKNRCLFIDEVDAWHSVVETRKSHVLVASPKLGLDSERADLQTIATRKGHAVVIPICGAWSGENREIIKLISPSKSKLEEIFLKAGYTPVRSRELAGAGANRLSALRRHLLGLGSLPPYATWDNAKLLSIAGLAGKWDGNNSADKRALGLLLGKQYGEWIEQIRPNLPRSDTPLFHYNERWRIVPRGEAWNALGPHLADADLDRFHETAIKVLTERDPQFDLPKNERYAAAIYDKTLEHSGSLRQGIAETLALLGSRHSVLTNCSHAKGEMTASLTVRKLLKKAEWDRWASLDHLLPMLAEAAPKDFLDVCEESLENLDESQFHMLFAQEGGDGFGDRIYTCGLLWALETLAWHPDYLTRSILILGDLASIDPGGNYSNRPSNSLADILLPWHLQTSASIEKRKAAVVALLKEHPEIGWKLLLNLLPHSHGITSGCRRPTWRNFIPADWQNTVTKGEYYDQILIYADMAIEASKNRIDKLSEIIERICDLPKPTLENLIAYLTSEEVINFPETKRLPLWEALHGLIIKHRRFSDANWAMQKEIIDKIEATANELKPIAPRLLYQHLFSGSDTDWFDDKGNYEEQQKRLEKQRQIALIEVLKNDGVSGVMMFVREVSKPYQAGRVFGDIANDSIEAEILPEFLKNEDEAIQHLLSGFVMSRFIKLGWSWVDNLLSAGWSVTQKNAFLLLLPFDGNSWLRVHNHLGTHEDLYWKNAIVSPWGYDGNLTEAIEKLIHYGRPNSAVKCIQYSLYKNKDFDPGLSTRALLSILESENQEKEFDQDAIIEIITKLQDCPSANIKDLFIIEWNFLGLLNQFSEGAPKTLENRLASNPAFFCELIQLVFRSTKKDETTEMVDEQEKNITKQAYRLLNEWKTPPGVQSGETFDPAAFKKWLEEVKKTSKETGHFEVSMSRIGHVLAHAPSDPDGLWIHHSIADALDSKDAKSMRSGYTVGLYNQRGPILNTSGRSERALAKLNRKKADDLELKGFHRFAKAMRGFADRYDEEADREESRDPYEN